MENFGSYLAVFVLTPCAQVLFLAVFIKPYSELMILSRSVTCKNRALSIVLSVKTQILVINMTECSLCKHGNKNLTLLIFVQLLIVQPSIYPASVNLRSYLQNASATFYSSSLEILRIFELLTLESAICSVTTANIQILWESFLGKSITFEVNFWETIDHMKANIQHKKEIPPIQWRLILLINKLKMGKLWVKYPKIAHYKSCFETSR